MLVLILIDVQYSQKAVFSFEEGSKCQNNSSSGFLHPVNPPPPFSKIYHPPPTGRGRGIYPSTSHRYSENPEIFTWFILDVEDIPGNIFLRAGQFCSSIICLVFITHLYLMRVIKQLTLQYLVITGRSHLL